MSKAIFAEQEDPAARKVAGGGTAQLEGGATARA